MQIVSSNSQSRWKDSVAAAASIDLCLIANGEEKTQVFSPKGVMVFAGIEEPEVAPTIALDGSGNLTTLKWIVYKYVYAATTRYPLVQSSQGAGGNVSPRSNPSPPSTAFQITGGNKKTSVTVTKTTRTDIDKIWIYRTQLFDTQELAEVAGEAGLLFYLGEVTNDGNTGTTIYSDNSLAVQEQIENDNLVAPTAQFACYYDPYFFLFGQNELEVEVDLSIAGVITILNIFDGTWFNGRDGQFVKMRGVDTGGFDGFGTFYFKWLTSTTAQLTLDQSGDTVASATFFGTTKAKVFGYSTTLYRSKPNNPFAWGETVTVGTAVISRSWVMKVGGGRGIAMTVIPASSLLKLDLQEPPKSYVFNLKQTQTEAFKGTRRLISDVYIPSGNFCQFSGLDENKQLQTFAIDSRNFAITKTDGGSVLPISDPVILQLRNIIGRSDQHVHFHGFYDPNTELNCFFYREENGLPTIHKMIYNHAPSNQWGTWDCFDILCSSPIQDTFTGKTIILGGTVSGYVGQLMYPEHPWNWVTREDFTEVHVETGQILEFTDLTQEIRIYPPEIITDINGRYFVLTGTYQGTAQYIVFYYTDGTAPQPNLVTYPIIGNDDYSNYLIYYVPVLYALTDTQVQMAEKLDVAIQLAKYATGMYPNFPFDSTWVDPEPFVDVTWTRPVLYSVPLNEYYDFNSGTTILMMGHKGGSYVKCLMEGIPQFEALPAFEGIIGNWAILEEIQHDQDTIAGNFQNRAREYIIWGRIKDIYSDEGEEPRVWVGFDLLYHIRTKTFLYGLSTIHTITPPDAYGNISIGITECLIRKYIDLAESPEIKQLNEIWLATGPSSILTSLAYDSLRIGYLNQLREFPYVYEDVNYDVQVNPNTINDELSFIRHEIQYEPNKTFGLAILSRSASALKLKNITLKV